MNTGKMSTLFDLARSDKKRERDIRFVRERRERDSENAQIDSTTSVILSSSSGQISGQFVNPNYDRRHGSISASPQENEDSV